MLLTCTPRLYLVLADGRKRTAADLILSGIGYQSRNLLPLSEGSYFSFTSQSNGKEQSNAGLLELSAVCPDMASRAP